MKVRNCFYIFLFSLSIVSGDVYARSLLSGLGLLGTLSLGDYLVCVNAHNLQVRDLKKKVEASKEMSADKSQSHNSEQADQSDTDKKDEVDQQEIQPTVEGYMKHTMRKLFLFTSNPIDFSRQPWFNLTADFIVWNLITGGYSKDFNCLFGASQDPVNAEVEKIAESVASGSKGAQRASIIRSLPPEVLTEVHVDQTVVAQKLKESFAKIDTEEAQKNKFYGVRKQLYEALHGAACARGAGKKVASRCVCLQGAPGVGKTRFAEEVAAQLDYAFYAIPLAGGRASNGLTTLFKGSESVFTDSEQGCIVKALQKMKDQDKSGLVILLDEIDKAADPMSILDLIDPEQNKKFQDLFLDIPIDLSSVLFIATSNDFDTLKNEYQVLANRLDRIDIPNYNNEEKKALVKEIVADSKQKIFMKQMVDFCKKYSTFIDQLIDTYEDANDGGVRMLFARLMRAQNMILWSPAITEAELLKRFQGEKK